MQILFKLSGSKKIGFGHISRSYSLANYFSSFYPKRKIIFWIDSPDINSVKKIIKNIKVIDEKRYKDSIDNYINKKSINLIIFDSIEENIESIKKIKKNCSAKLIGLDYFNYKYNNLDLIINLYNHNKIGLNKHSNYKGKYLEGIKFAIIKDSLIEKFSKNKKKIKKKITNILLSFGGADMRNHTETVLLWLKNQNYNGNVYISSNLYRKNILKLKNIKDLYKFNIKVFQMNLKFDQLLELTDIIFCGGGTTLLESCYIGIPAIVMPQNTRELHFSKMIEKNKSAYVISNIDKETNKVNKLIHSYALRKKIHKSQISFVDGSGKKRIRKAIFNLKN